MTTSPYREAALVTPARCVPPRPWLLPVLADDGIEWEPGTFRVARDPRDGATCRSLAPRRCR